MGLNGLEARVRPGTMPRQPRAGEVAPPWSQVIAAPPDANKLRAIRGREVRDGDEAGDARPTLAGRRRGEKQPEAASASGRSDLTGSAPTIM